MMGEEMGRWRIQGQIWWY